MSRHVRPRGALALATLALALLGGCAVGYQRHGRVIDVRDVARLEPGVSTKQDVLDLFGPPSNLSRTDGLAPAAALEGAGTEAAPRTEDYYRYEYLENDETFFTLLLYTYWSRATLADSLLVIFDDEEVVKYVAFARQTEAEPEEDEEDG